MSQFVDPFTGDFSYSIPIMDVEGYPLILNYNSNVSMTSEASWVGLGWNLDVGSINREMRGIPDEFNGSQSVTRTFNKLNDETEGDKGGGYIATTLRKWPLKPKIQLTALWGKYTNTYVGKSVFRQLLVCQFLKAIIWPQNLVWDIVLIQKVESDLIVILD
jgi:hypothetical protein